MIKVDSRKIVGAIILIFIITLMVRYFTATDIPSTKEQFEERKKTFNTYSSDSDDDDLDDDIRKYKSYFREDDSIAAIRIHAYKVKAISTWRELNLQKFDKKNFNVSNDNPIHRLSFLKDEKSVFKEKYENVHKPCVITDMANDWPATKLWNFDYFNDKYGNYKFSINNKELKFKYWHHYATHSKHRMDDDPIYIFDQSFLQRPGTSKLGEDYKVPSWFDEDELSILSDWIRPPHAWLIVGIPRSGSSLHIDPLATHAWNTLVRGRKRWVLFPPETKFTDEDKSLSGHLWFNKVLPKYKKIRHYDFVQEEGDTIFLPVNWWHITLVVEDSMCVTQNYIGKSNMKMAKDSIMKERPKLFRYWMEEKGIVIQNEDKFVREDVYDSTDSEMSDDDDDDDE